MKSPVYKQTAALIQYLTDAYPFSWQALNPRPVAQARAFAYLEISILYLDFKSTLSSRQELSL